MARPDATFADYLHFGGFPEPLALSDGDGDRLRQQYFTDILERDVRERVGARSTSTLRRVVQMVFESMGSEASLRRFAGAAGLAVETVAGYLDACESAYLLFSVPYYAHSERRRAVRNKKYYPVDAGLRRMVVTKLGADRGKTLEGVVHLALRRRGFRPSYWRGEREVDFVVTTRDGVVPIQVSEDEDGDARDLALEEFYQAFPHAQEAVRIGVDDVEKRTIERLVPA